jgi:hypothetical protein
MNQLPGRVRGGLLLMVAVHLLLLNACQITKAPVATPGPQYVRVEQVNDRWWFARGNERFLSLGVNVVQPMDGDKGDGRRYDALSKYSGDKTLWARDAKDRLRLWGFNTAGAWCDEVLYQQPSLYHTRIVWLGAWGQHDSRLIDVFSDTYAADLDKTAREQIAPHATNEYLVGWFLNNEQPWYGERGWPTSPKISVLSRYMHLPPKAPGKVRLLEFLKDQYAGDFAAFAANWSVNAKSFDELAGIRQIEPRRREAKKDAVAWVGIVAEQFFKLSSETLRRYDPNHLFLGVRFAERAPEPVIAACGRYADVVSVNHYRKTGILGTGVLGAVAALTQKPVLITEFSWRAMENSSGCPNSSGADVTVETQRDRADGYRRYVTNALAQPYIVGCHWFMYHDQPPTGRFDGEDSNYGLVDIQDQFYTTLLGAITEVNGQAFGIHELSRQTTPAYDPGVLADYREIRVPTTTPPPPAPLVFVDGSSTPSTWSDTPGGAKIEIEPSGSNTFLLTVTPGKGWGCGVTFTPAPALPKNADGSVDARGVQRAVVTMRMPEDRKFSVGIQESGHGNTDSQTFDGFGGADGESYVHPEIVTTRGQTEHVFELRECEPSSAYGNQRGNHVVDSQAASTVHLYFPGNQNEFQAELLSIRFE